MRHLFLAAPLAVCLRLAMVLPVAADTAPPPEGGLTVTVTAATVQAKTGLLTVRGEITCEVDLDNLGAFVDVTRKGGRFRVVQGFGDAEGLSCVAGETIAFSTSFTADQGKFTPGRATYSVAAQGQGGCVEDPDTGDMTCENEGFATQGPLAIRLGARH